MDGCSPHQVIKAIHDEGENLISRDTTLIVLKMSSYHSKITEYAKKQQNVNLSQEKTETIPEEALTLTVLVKEAISNILNMLNVPEEMMGKELKEIRKKMYIQIGNVNKEK